MNKFIFLYKFYINKQHGRHYNWNLLFPFAGVIVGCVTVALTLSIMDGMEFAIFNKLQNVSFPAKLSHISDDSIYDLQNYLSENKINYQLGIDDQVLIVNQPLFRMVTIHGIEKFPAFCEKVFGNNLTEINIETHLTVIYLGNALAGKLDISIGDTVDISAPKQINIFSGLPPKHTVIVGGIYELDILDYDQKHIFTDYSAISDFLPDNRTLLYLHEIPGEYLSNEIRQYFPNVIIHSWIDEHNSFVSAMNLEKIAYSVIGFLIVCIASFTLMSMMSLAVFQKIPQIGILKAMGAKKKNIGAIFIFQALMTWLISIIVSTIITVIIIEIDKFYHLIQIFFPNAIFFDFPLILKNEYILLIMIVSLILLLSAAVYPSMKAAQLDTVESIGLK